MKNYFTHFFKYEGNSFYNDNNYPFSRGTYSLAHIIFLALVFVLIPLACYLLRNSDKKRILLYLRISAITWIFFEFFKMARIAYFNISDLKKEIPIQLCSLFLYCLAFASFSKGRLKKASEYFLSTMGVVCGFFGLTFPTILDRYPFFHFNPLHSMIYHAFMMFTGIWLLTSKYVRLESKNHYLNLFFTYSACFFAVIINEITGVTNYIYLLNGKNTPLAVLDVLPHPLYVTVILALLLVLNTLLFVPVFIRERIQKKKRIKN